MVTSFCHADEMQIQEEIKQWVGNEQQEVLNKKISLIETFKLDGRFECTEKVVGILFR